MEAIPYISLLLLLAALIGFFGGLIKPGRFMPWKATANRRDVLKFYPLTIFILFIVTGLLAPDTEPQGPEPANNTSASDRIDQVATQQNPQTEPAGELSDHANPSTDVNEPEVDAADDVDCSLDLACWAGEHKVAAEVYCQDAIERLARYDYEWTDGFLGSKLSRIAWADQDAGVIRYFGDQVRFSNGFGASQNMIYSCDFDPASETVVNAQAQEGRL
ncbi:MAG: hypothetical protein WEB57_08195 [Pseudohongiellaceae bacterium]